MGQLWLTLGLFDASQDCVVFPYTYCTCVYQQTCLNLKKKKKRKLRKCGLLLAYNLKKMCLCFIKHETLWKRTECWLKQYCMQHPRIKQKKIFQCLKSVLYETFVTCESISLISKEEWYAVTYRSVWRRKYRLLFVLLIGVGPISVLLGETAGPEAVIVRGGKCF